MPEPTQPTSPNRDFSRAKRLLNGPQFQRVFDGAECKVGHSHLLLLAAPNSLDHPRLGLVIAKKNVRHAVDRNKVKRVARECFRHSQLALGPLDIIVLARRGIGELDNSQLHKLFENAFKRLSRKANGQ
ncbi:ribonuclease P protein component [Porticoccus sp. W117]|uniref:ribonuclease P protein component n=1 Tax=Porticoccus sp. W117 TaxID=3054777 RepID=UPI00259143BD|nr:ribonuclease P protein component [Porticoccus sp. W117]MDM3870780.1 ribonuclease P protein component [Porticoccus sp. W117]